MKRKPVEDRRKNVTLSLNPVTIDRMKNFADQTGRSMSWLVDKSVTEYLDVTEPKLEEALGIKRDADV